MTSFEDVGVRARTAESLAAVQITMPNAVQSAAIPPLLARSDVVIESPTGSGKTLAFAVPLVERLAGHSKQGVRALVVTPTRELATQVAAVLRSVDGGLRVVVAIGGVGYGPQVSGLAQHPDVVVGCPGRLVDLAARGNLRLQAVQYLVLDEADEMLDRGFAPDVERLIALCPGNAAPLARQTVLVSATMPAWVKAVAAKHLVDPTRITVAAEAEPDLEHAVVRIDAGGKLDLLSSLLRRQLSQPVPQTIVFHRTKHGAKKLARDLVRLGHAAVELQGNLSQNARDRSIASFRTGESAVLVATNVAARGIDVAEVGLVVNYELPESAQWLTHRVGRTARNGAAGRALTLLSDLDAEQWRKLRRTGAPELPLVDHTALLADGSWNVEPTHMWESSLVGKAIGRQAPPRRGGASSGHRPTERSADVRSTARSQQWRRRRYAKPAGAGAKTA